MQDLLLTRRAVVGRGIDTAQGGHMAGIRPLDVRLAEYRDSMGLMAPQLQDIIDRLPPGTEVGHLEDAMKFYAHVANDLTKLLNGEELPRFVVEGQLP